MGVRMEISTIEPEKGSRIFEKTMNSKEKSFTLLELLTVIAIMGMLASIVLVSLARARERARYAKAQSELNQIRKAIILAQDRENKVLGEITGSYCSECPCRNRDPSWCLLPDDSGDPCYVSLRNAFNRIGLTLMRDPWGCPYLIDENEMEQYPSPPPRCRHDTVNSAGPNRVYTGDPLPGIPCSKCHDEEVTPCDDDGPGVKVPFYKCVSSDIICPGRTCPNPECQ